MQDKKEMRTRKKLRLLYRFGQICKGSSVGGGGRYAAPALDEPRGSVAAWLRKLAPSRTMSERTFKHCVSPSPAATVRDRATHPSQVAAIHHTPP
jgi:hypothetical protein